MATQDDAVAEVIARERESLRPEVRASAAALDRLLDPGFREIGASGRLWTRAAVIEAVPAWEQTAPILDEDMEGRCLGGGLVLLTYVSDHDGRRARRSSLWRRSGGSWRMVFHQGTLLP
jgi:hypothetical protein